MAYAATTTTVEKVYRSGVHRTYTIAETEASSASETSFSVPKLGRITFIQWELTTPGTSTTMRPTFRTATGAWDGSGANSNDDVNRISSAAAQGQDQTTIKYHAPNGLLYYRSGCDNAATDAMTETILVILEGHE